MVIDEEKLIYLLKFTDHYIDLLVDNVLNDSIEDPEYSAVTATNLIKCIIKTYKDIGKKLPYCDVKGYLLYNLYTERQYDIFEEKRKNESTYYIGKQF